MSQRAPPKEPPVIEFEILPPEDKAGTGQDAWLKLLAYVMDDLFRVPGTNFRFGLDPLLGLFQGFGDATSGLISSLALVQCLRAGLPKIVLARMATNIMLNAVVGAIPIVGDAFSFWFKSNRRNYDLLHRHAGTRPVSTRRDWIFVIALIASLVLIIATSLFATLFLFAKLIEFVIR